LLIFRLNTEVEDLRSELFTSTATTTVNFQQEAQQLQRNCLIMLIPRNNDGV